VENQSSEKEYDFFLVPQFTTQGCVLPTHFYVAYNDSQMKKKVVEDLTFALCHYYYNWAGPIKVPAPCMYAHKIAELFMNIKEMENNRQYEKMMGKQPAPKKSKVDADGKQIEGEEEEEDEYSRLSHKLAFKVCESLHFL